MVCHSRLLSFIFILLLHADVFAQQNSWGVNIDDTLTTSEITEIKMAARNSTFGYFYLADSCSKKGDSIGASNYMLKIDPYALMFEEQTPDSINEYVARHFTLTQKAKDQYITLFNKIYTKPRSKAYKDFKAMAMEDQALRIKQATCRDSLCRATTDDELQYSDSAHFIYLYNYIEKYGWPSLADGSMYATVLAIHDHEHAEYYLPVVRKAVLDGRVEVGALRLIVYWNARSREYATMDDYLATHTYIKYDITDALDSDKLPRLLPEIEKTVKEHCPIKPIYFVESKRNKAAFDQIHRLLEYSLYECPISRLDTCLVPLDSGAKSDYRSGMEDGLWSVWWKPSDHEDVKLIVYLVFDRPDADIRYKKVLAGERFTNRPIQFDYNSSAIKSEYVGFVFRLATWLKHFPTVKIEIDGYTDNEGSPDANMKLSQARADEVKNQLIAMGVDGARLTTKAYGSTKPISTNTSSQGKEMNRRVELIKL